MLKNMKLGTKIAAGFSSLLAIAILLGGLAVWNMWSVQSRAELLVKESVPEVTVANNVERNSLHTMYEMRGYSFSEDPKYYDNASKELAQVTKFLAEAKTLGESSPRMESLKTATASATEKVSQYEALAKQTNEKIVAMEADRTKLNAAAKEYMDACDEFHAGQTARMTEELGGYRSRLQMRSPLLRVSQRQPPRP